MTASALSNLLSQAFKGPGVSLALSVGLVILIPAILLLLTSFTRIVVVLSFVRTAIGTPTAPPNMVVIGLALLLTAFTMEPILAHLNTVALVPLMSGKANPVQAAMLAEPIARKFLFSGTSQANLGILYHAQHLAMPKGPGHVPFLTLALGFIVTQLTLAFQMAVLIYLPFLLLDLIVSSILVSLGMMMLPPTMVSLPLKLLLFVAVGGWGLVVGSLLTMPHL